MKKEKGVPNTPFSTRLSGSAKETELRLRSIFQWKKKRPPVVLLLLILVLLLGICGGLVAFSSTPRNGPMNQVYPEYFVGNSVDHISYFDKNDYGYPYLERDNKNFVDAMEYLGGTELRAVWGHKRYIGDFNFRNGAFTLEGEGEIPLTIELYPDGYVVISEGWGLPERNEKARVYRAETFDKTEFLRYWNLHTPEEKELPVVDGTPPRAPGTVEEDLTELEQRMEFIKQLVQVQSSYIRSALLDGNVLLVPEMKLASLPGSYRRTLVLTDDQEKLLEGEPFRDQTVICTYENDNVVIKTIAFRYDAVLPDGSKPEDTSVQYIYSVTAKTNQVVSLLSGLHIGDASPFGLEGEYTMEGRPCLKYSYQNGIVNGLHAWAIRDMETYRYADLSDLRLFYDGRMVILGSSLPLYAQRVADIPKTDATQEILTCVDTIYQTGATSLWGFLLPGTGPIAVPMDDFYEEVYNLFAGYEWIRWEGETPQKVDDNRTFYFTGAGNTTIVLDDKRAYINVMEGNSTGGWNTWYYAGNEDGELLSALIDLWDGPDLYYAMFRHLDQIDNDQELAATYVKWFQKYYLSTGAIEDIRWHETTIQDSDETYLRILVRYSVKPVDLTNTAWQRDAVSEDGWVDVALSIALEKTAPHQVSFYQNP